MEESIVLSPLESENFHCLETFLYHAIFIPEGVAEPPYSIIDIPDLQVYIHRFGEYPSDIGWIASHDRAVIGAAWVRLMDDYGHVDDDIPSLAISLLPSYRSKGIGTKLLIALLNDVKKHGFKGVSLSVQRENYARGLYEKLGFVSIEENDEELKMILLFDKDEDRESD